MQAKPKNLLGIFSTIICIVLLVIVIFTSTPINATNSIAPNHTKNNFLVITDIHLDAETKRSMTINPIMYNTQNDLDKKTFIKMLTEISNGIKNQVIAKPKFILLLGDIASHGHASPPDIQKSEALVFRLLKSHFPSIPIFYVFGNIDSFSGDYQDFISTSKEHNSPYRVAEKNTWKNGFLSTGNICSLKDKNHFPCLITTNRKIGHYSAYIYPNLRLITLNSIAFFAKRKDKNAEQESQEELKWFAEQLHEAQNNDESVLIAMHIPPGNNIVNHIAFLRDSCNKSFLENIKTYQDNIIGILAGHTHTEEFKIIQDITEENKYIGLVLINAGLSTSHGNAPAIRTFYMTSQDEQWQLFDYTTFSFDIDKHKNIFLKKLYNYRDKYCSADQKKNSSMLECLSNSTSDDITAKLVEYYTVKNPNFSGIILSPKDIFIQQ